MKDYLKRTGELLAITFLAAAVPVLADKGLSKAAVAGAVSAGVAAVYALVAKGLGDKDKPTVTK